MTKSWELTISQALAKDLFEVVPSLYETFCPLVSRIAADVFRRFNVAANLLPCQLWQASDEGNHVIGFMGNPAPEKWDGHVVCVTSTMLIDAAVRGLHRDFNFAVPAVAVVERFNATSHAIARLDLEGSRRLWWFNPPYGFDTTPPLQPVEMIDEYASALADRIRARIGDEPPSVASAA